MAVTWEEIPELIVWLVLLGILSYSTVMVAGKARDKIGELMA
jgi:hypothetical protein